MHAHSLSGLHIIADLKCTRGCEDGAAFMHQLTGIIQHLGLEEVGRSVHHFEGGGFTAVVCLTESHLSIHTWPEFSQATFDAFLSNQTRVNDDKVEALWEFVQAFFGAGNTVVQRIQRGFHDTL